MRDKKNYRVFFIFIFVGMILGGALSSLVGLLPESLPRSSFLNTSKPFEMSVGMNEAVRNQDGTVKEFVEREPIYIDLGVFAFKFGFAWRFNFMSVIGFVIAYVLYRNIRI